MTIAFILGSVFSIVFWRRTKKKGLFRRSEPRTWYKILLGFEQFLLVVATWFLFIVLGGHMASNRVVKKELHKGISTYASYLEEDYFRDPDNKERFINALDMVYHSGHWVDEMNEAAATAMAEDMLSESQAQWANNWLGVSLASGYIQEKIEDTEKQLLTAALAVGFAKLNIDVDTDPEVVEDLFNRWIETDYTEDMFDVEKSIADNLHSAFKPLILSLFMPWILVCLGVILIPFVDLGIYRFVVNRKAKATLPQSADNPH